MTAPLRPFAFAAALAILLSGGLAWAQPCNDATECQTGFCVDFVCCDTACDAPCEACSTLEKGGGPDGVCGQAAVGARCSESSCDPATFEFVPPDTCDASGVCQPGGPPVSCDMGGGECFLDLCHDQNGCEVVLAPDGEPCSGGMVCIDGVCGGEAGGSGGSGGAGGDDNGSGGNSFSEGGSAPSGADAGTEINSGCGCELPSANTQDSAGWLLLGLVFLRRRRSSV